MDTWRDVGAISRKFLVPPPATVPLFWVFLVSGRKQLVVGWKLEEEEEEEDVGFNHSSVIRVRLCLIRVLMNQSTLYQILSPSSPLSLSLSLTLSYNFIHEKRCNSSVCGFTVVRQDDRRLRASHQFYFSLSVVRLLTH